MEKAERLYELWERLARQRREQIGEPRRLGPPPSVTATDLRAARWGGVLPENPTEAEKAVYAKVGPLLELRAREMGTPPEKVAVLRYRAGWQVRDFLWEENRKVTPGNMRVDRVPYYLCIVASPESIPWEFQAYLDSEYAVGRLWFDDPEDAGRYVAHRLKASEISPRPAKLCCIAPVHTGDGGATRDSCDMLAKPLHEVLADYAPVALWEAQATRASMLEWLKAEENAPAVVFFAGHGKETPEMGALYLADGLLSSANIPAGMAIGDSVFYAFACYGAGGPEFKEPALHLGTGDAGTTPYVSKLPQRLLASGCGAFLGHVGRAWDYGFLDIAAREPQVTVFYEVLLQMLKGIPVGQATDYLNQRTRSLNQDLMELRKEAGKLPQFRASFLAYMDCLGNVLIGDPAVALRSTGTAG